MVVSESVKHTALSGSQSFKPPALPVVTDFNPQTTTREVENYTVNLDRVTILELSIIPDIRGGETRASLTRLQLA